MYVVSMFQSADDVGKSSVWKVIFSIVYVLLRFNPLQKHV